MTFWDILLFIVSCLLIVIIILQESKEDAANAFTGEKSAQLSNQKKVGIEVLISRSTTVLSILFFVLTLICALFIERV